MKSFLKGLFIAIILIGCQNTFIDDYNKFVTNQPSAAGEVPAQTADYFAKIEEDNGLLLKATLPYPVEVKASQSRYPDKIELSWKAVELPTEANKVTYWVYRKEVTAASSGWTRVAVDLKDCFFVDNVQQPESEGTITEEEIIPGGDSNNEGGDSTLPEVTLSLNDDESPSTGIQEGVDYHYAVRAVYTVSTGQAQEILQGSRLSYFSVGNLFRNVWRMTASYRENLNQISLNWFPVQGATYYRIDRAEVTENSETLDWKTIKDRTSQTSYVDYSVDVSSSGVEATKEFRYRVLPFYEENGKVIMAKLGPQTLSILGALLAVGAPPAPVITAVSKGEYGGGVKIQWEAIPGMSFRVYRANSPESPFEPIALTAQDADSYLDTLSDVSDRQRLNTFYYRVSARNPSNVDGKLSEFSEDNHNGYGFFIEEGRISASKRVYPQQVDLIFDFKTPPQGDAFFVQYTEDDTNWNWVKNDGSTVAVSDGSFSMEDGISPETRKLVVKIPDYNQSKSYSFQICSVKKSLVDDISKLFKEDDKELYGQSNVIKIEAGLSGPEIPQLKVSQGDPSFPNKIKIEGSWTDLPADYGNYVDLQLIRLYRFGKDTEPASKPIAVKQKVVRDFGQLTIENGQFSFTDDLAPDINPTEDTIEPMKAKIAKGSTWTYWTWDREAWKYINRKQPFDMKASVGCEYKVVAKWKNPGSGEWPQSESLDTTYGYPALNNDDFTHLILWMREVAMNRLWHLLYAPYHGTLATIIEILPSPQTKNGEYGGEVGYTAKIDGLGGSGTCWLRHYSDWGPEWDIHIEPFAIAMQFGSNVDFDMNIIVKTPLYDGQMHLVVTLQNGMYCDKPRGGHLTITQADGRKQEYKNLEKDDSIASRYFPEKSYEQRVLGQEDANNSYELTTINFKYPLKDWIEKRAEDWVIYYGFKF